MAVGSWRLWSRWVGGVVLVAGMLVSGGVAAEEGGAGLPEVERHRFENGLTLYHMATPRSERLHLRCVVWGGRNSEPEGAAGMEHLLEHLLFYQSDVSMRDFEAEVEEKGGSYNGQSRFRNTIYYVELPAEHLSFGADWLHRVVHHEVLPLEKLDSAKEIIRLEESWDGPVWLDRLTWPLDQYVPYLFYPLWYEDYDFWERTFGIDLNWEEATHLSVAGITGDALEAHYRTRYVPSNMTMLSVGPQALEELVEVLSPGFGALAAGEQPALRPLSAAHEVREYRTTEAGVDESSIEIGHLLNGGPDTDMAFRLFYASVYDSLLTDVLRHDEESTYAIDADVGAFGGSGYVSFDFTCPRATYWKNLARCEAIVFGDVRAHLSEEDYGAYWAAFGGRMFNGWSLDWTVSILMRELEWRYPYALPDRLFESYRALEEMDYEGFVAGAESLRRESVPLMQIVRATGWWTLLELALFFGVAAAVRHRLVSHRRGIASDAVVWETHVTLFPKFFCVVFLLFVTVVINVWVMFPLEFLPDLPPKLELLFDFLLSVPDGAVCGLVWVTAGCLIPSRLVATSEGLYVYTMGCWRWEIPYASVRDVTVSHGWRQTLAWAVRSSLFRQWGVAFHVLGLERVRLTRRSGRPVCLAVRDAERWARIVREGVEKYEV